MSQRPDHTNPGPGGVPGFSSLREVPASDFPEVSATDHPEVAGKVKVAPSAFPQTKAHSGAENTGTSRALKWLDKPRNRIILAVATVALLGIIIGVVAGVLVGKRSQGER